MENNEICLHDNNTISIRLWAAWLQEDGVEVFLKDKLDPPPPESGLSPDCFVLCIQAEFQKNQFRKLGSDFVSIDATHNTTQYTGAQLYTLLVRDMWGHGVLCGTILWVNYSLHTGVPVVWMLSSSGTQATIAFFLNFVKARSPEIRPAIIMTDCDKAQMNAIMAVYPASQLLLCWWHVLRAMRMHFRTEEFPDLWKRVRAWVKIADKSKFDAWWEEMQANPSVPQSFVDYLKVNWIPIIPLWSGSSRQGQTIFQESDTNMLIES